ncbi:hypothetical protein D8I35_05590 [Corticibacter populi]|uniref:Uncharacterized protein n=2 Tax=Corticibacter populi TaxID=1550736 RepID=A0A3M6R0X5_9BURK|nr:hypothetical protein D8I35_05590 [Corticibacter populi]
MAAIAGSALALTACGDGGGNDDDPEPSDDLGVLTVSAASADGYNGIYGNGNIGLTDVERNDPVISDKPEVCAFNFDRADKVGDGTKTAEGDLRYRPDTSTIYEAYVTIADKKFSSDDWDSTTKVDRDGNRVVFDGSQLKATDDSGISLTLHGAIPLPGNRPEGC